MASRDTTVLTVEQREPSGSRSARRLRREGKIPGVVYGGGDEPVAFQVDSRVLRQALAHQGAVLDLQIGGAGGTPVVVKEQVHHPVTGETVHLDLLRVRLDRPIQATVVLELVGGDDAPGVKEGGVLEQVTRELTVEALPTEIPDSLQHDVSGLVIGDTVTLEALTSLGDVRFVDDPETVIATLTPPRLQLEEEPELEEETELVGEGAEAAEREEAADSGESGGEGDADGGDE